MENEVGSYTLHNEAMLLVANGVHCTERPLSEVVPTDISSGEYHTHTHTYLINGKSFSLE